MMNNKEHFSKVLSDTNLALCKSPTKGITFWYNILLPESKTNWDLNKKAWKNLKEIFIQNKPAQINLVEKVITNLKYIREQVLKNDYARKQVEELKNFLLQNVASECMINEVQEYVSTNHNKIKKELENKKSSQRISKLNHKKNTYK